jgi:hypothetical protein
MPALRQLLADIEDTMEMIGHQLVLQYLHLTTGRLLHFALYRSELGYYRFAERGGGYLCRVRAVAL